MIVYDGRISKDCEQDCVQGVCDQPKVSGFGCGGCCGCLGGCPLGYYEQRDEENGEDSPDRHQG